MVPFITSAVAPVKCAWKLACAHSFPCTPGVVDVPFCVWQVPQSKAVTLTSACVSCAFVPAGTPVFATPATELVIVELVRPLGRLLLVPMTVPRPLAVPWQLAQPVTVGAFGWYTSERLHALPVGFASAWWHAAQSRPATVPSAWLIHCAPFDVVPPSASAYVTVDCVAMAGFEPAWQSVQAVGCVVTPPCSVPVRHSVTACDAPAACDSAVPWQRSHACTATEGEACFIAYVVPLATSDFAVSAISG